MLRKGVRKGKFRPLPDFLCIVRGIANVLYAAHNTRLGNGLKQSGTLFAVRLILAFQEGFKVDPFLNHAFLLKLLFKRL